MQPALDRVLSLGDLSMLVSNVPIIFYGGINSPLNGQSFCLLKQSFTDGLLGYFQYSVITMFQSTNVFK